MKISKSILFSNFILAALLTTQTDVFARGEDHHGHRGDSDYYKTPDHYERKEVGREKGSHYERKDFRYKKGLDAERNSGPEIITDDAAAAAAAAAATPAPAAGKGR
ncbi:MAG: hypothetical protein K2X28_03415 [Alphaproteobacteria bacterium]|nr:hypothetical protein [Alphaproteobacteria bacterium]